MQPHEFIIDSRSRIVLVGENGNGKSTLLKLLMGELEPTTGEVVRNRHARFSLVNQHHVDQLDLSKSPLQMLKERDTRGNGSDEWLRSMQKYLEQSGLPAELLKLPASALSGGQRSRLSMALVSFERPHVLVMDEPTNNLDLSSVEALAESVARFEGGVVVVSHDQHFVSKVARDVWVVEGGAVKPAECGFEEYQAKVLARVAPGSELAEEALGAYLEKKLVQSEGRLSRLILNKEAAKLRRGVV